jgi:hypothetical protein
MKKYAISQRRIEKIQVSYSVRHVAEKNGIYANANNSRSIQ